MTEMEELREDILELKELRASAKRKCSWQTLDEKIQRCSNLLDECEKKTSASTERLQDNTSAPKEAATKVYTVTLRTYSWDQSDKFMKLYVNIPGLSAQDASKVSCSFSQLGVQLDVQDLSAKNYQLIVNNLAKPITKEKSHWKVKSEMVVVFLSKASPSLKWAAVTSEEAKLKEKSKSDVDSTKKEDPSANIMGLMQKMYEDGDDSMKQMLNKTWYESQNKTAGGGPGMGGLGGPGMGGLGGPGMGGLGGSGMGGLGGPGMGGLGGPGMGGLGGPGMGGLGGPGMGGLGGSGIGGLEGLGGLGGLGDMNLDI